MVCDELIRVIMQLPLHGNPHLEILMKTTFLGSDEGDLLGKSDEDDLLGKSDEDDLLQEPHRLLPP